MFPIETRKEKRERKITCTDNNNNPVGQSMGMRKEVLIQTTITKYVVQNNREKGKKEINKYL